MAGSLTIAEAVVLIGAGTAAVGYLAFSLINGDSAHAVAGLVAYLAVWFYGLLRASYT